MGKQDLVCINTLRPRQYGRLFQTTFSNAFSWMKMYKFRLRFHWNLFPKGPINHIPTLVQIMAWRRPGDKLLSESMMVSLLAHICVTRPQWVKLDCMKDKGLRNNLSSANGIGMYVNIAHFWIKFEIEKKNLLAFYGQTHRRWHQYWLR